MLHGHLEIVVVRSLLLAGGFLLVSSCSHVLGFDEPQSERACADDSDCAPKDRCVFGACAAPCQRDTDCLAGSACLAITGGAACVSAERVPDAVSHVSVTDGAPGERGITPSAAGDQRGAAPDAADSSPKGDMGDDSARVPDQVESGAPDWPHEAATAEGAGGTRSDRGDGAADAALASGVDADQPDATEGDTRRPEGDASDGDASDGNAPVVCIASGSSTDGFTCAGATPVCVDGACRECHNPDPGLLCADSVTPRGCNDGAWVKRAACNADACQICSGGACVVRDLSSDPDNCGSCNRACSARNMQTRSCTGGSCSGTCATGFGDCNEDKTVDGCETDLTSDPNHCSSCTGVCKYGVCREGTCAFTRNGYFTPGTESANRFKNTMYCHRIYIDASGKLAALGMDTGTGTPDVAFRLALYTSSSGAPLQLLAETAELLSAPQAAIEGPVSATLTAAGYYWLCLVTASTLRVTMERSITAPAYSGSYTYGAFRQTAPILELANPEPAATNVYAVTTP